MSSCPAVRRTTPEVDVVGQFAEDAGDATLAMQVGKVERAVRLHVRQRRDCCPVFRDQG